MADQLAKQEMLLVPSAIPCSLSVTSCRIHFSFLLDWRRTTSSKIFEIQLSLVSSEEVVLSRRPCYALSRLLCNGNSFLLSSYFSRIGRIENPSCSACGYQSQDTFHLVLHCPATDSLHRSLFGDSLSLYDLWSSPGSGVSLSLTTTTTTTAANHKISRLPLIKS